MSDLQHKPEDYKRFVSLNLSAPEVAKVLGSKSFMVRKNSAEWGYELRNGKTPFEVPPSFVKHHPDLRLSDIGEALQTWIKAGIPLTILAEQFDVPMHRMIFAAKHLKALE